MAYSLEGKDLVISGFESGIADSPHSGISDMRNVDPLTVPGEAGIAFGTQNTQPTVTAAVFTADNTTEFLTWAGGTLGDYIAITVSNSGGALPGGLTANTTYYVRNSTSTTFQLSAKPSGSIINITNNGSGTNTFSTVNIGTPKYMNPYNSGGTFYYFMIDDLNRAWVWGDAPLSKSYWIYLNNPVASVLFGSGIVVYDGYIFAFRDSVIDYISLGAMFTGSWTAIWQTLTGGGNINQAIVASADDVVYICNGHFIATFFQKVGKTFDPSDATTYSFADDAPSLPLFEQAQCISQLQTNILVGGVFNVVYQWDRTSVGYVSIFISDQKTSQIVCVNTSAYIFAGVRGRIYITNGSQAQLFKKVPDHLSGTINPLFSWGGASYQRGNLYFGITCTTNGGTEIDQYGGLWAIELESKTMWVSNQLSYANYSGGPTCIMPIYAFPTGKGYGLFIGWSNFLGSTTGVDITYSTPYTGGQSYVDSDLIPIGDFYNQVSPSQVEWKTTAPLVFGESVSLYYRLQFSDSYTLIGTSSTVGIFSDALTANFQKAQWLQIRAVLTGTASSPSYVRLKELRLKNYAQ